MSEVKDILAGETCELIAAQAMDTGYKAEWKLTLRYEGHTFTVKAFAEHERLFKAAGFYLPDRLQGERKYLAPYSVVVELDPKRNQRRVVAIFNQYGEIRKLEDYLERPKAEAVAPKEDEPAPSASATPDGLSAKLELLEKLAGEIYEAMPASSIAAQVLFNARYMNDNAPKPKKPHRHERDFDIMENVYREKRGIYIELCKAARSQRLAPSVEYSKRIVQLVTDLFSE